MIRSILVHACLAFALASPAIAQESRDAATTPTIRISQPPSDSALDAFRSTKRQNLLIEHGVNPTGAELVAFLESGFSDAAMKRGLPTEPETKAEVVVAAIKELGILRETSAVPYLAQMVEGVYPGGVARVVTRDLERTPVGLHERANAAFHSTFALNSIVALGLIGDTSTRGTVTSAMRASADTPFQIECAVSLALLGSTGGLQTLVPLAASDDPAESTAAFNAVFYITGRNYGVGTDTSIARRKRVAAELADWARDSASANADAREVLRRRIEGPPREAIPPDTVRGLLRETRNPVNQSTRMAARTALVDRSDSIAFELRGIALDPMEDSDIRAEAARWYSMVDEDKGREVLRRLRKDPNPPVAKAAEALLKKK